jgi:hypothetical protein
MKAGTSAVADVAGLVAEAYAAHERHTWLKARQEFAQELADTFTRMRPSTDHKGDQGVARGIEACARVALRLAGLDADLNAAEQNRTEVNR